MYSNNGGKWNLNDLCVSVSVMKDTPSSFSDNMTVDADRYLQGSLSSEQLRSQDPMTKFKKITVL